MLEDLVRDAGFMIDTYTKLADALDGIGVMDWIDDRREQAS